MSQKYPTKVWQQVCFPVRPLSSLTHFSVCSLLVTPFVHCPSHPYLGKLYHAHLFVGKKKSPSFHLLPQGFARPRRQQWGHSYSHNFCNIMYNTQQWARNKLEKEYLCSKVVVYSAAFMPTVFLVGPFRKPELMQWSMNNRVQLVKAPGSLQSRRIDLCKPWP